MNIRMHSHLQIIDFNDSPIQKKLKLKKKIEEHDNYIHRSHLRLDLYAVNHSVQSFKH